jgi:hypothetical protein
MFTLFLARRRKRNGTISNRSRFSGSNGKRSRKPRFGTGKVLAIAATFAVALAPGIYLATLPARPIAASGFAVCGQLVAVTITYSDGTVTEAPIGDEATTDIIGKLKKGHKLLLGAPAPACVPAKPKEY